MKYDDAFWHTKADFPRGFPKEYGGTHIGLYLRWCFVQGWAGKKHVDSHPTEVSQVISGYLSGTDFLFRFCEGKLTDDDLNLEGNRFTEQYYGDNDWYLSDYTDQFGEFKFRTSEQEHDFEQLSHLLESRLSGIDMTDSIELPAIIHKNPPEKTVVEILVEPLTLKAFFKTLYQTTIQSVNQTY